MNYGELKTAIQDFCQNSESSFVTHIPDFVRTAEDRVFFTIELPAFWKDDTSQTCSVGVGEYTLEAGVLDVVSVRISQVAGAQAGGVEYGPVQYLLEKDYDFLLEAYPGTSGASTTALPKYYAISSAGVKGETTNPDLTIRLGPIPDALYPITVNYYGKVSADSITTADSKETWLGVTSPDCLLYGALVQAYTYMKGEPDMIQYCEKQFLDSLAILQNLTNARLANDGYRPDTSSPVGRG